MTLDFRYFFDSACDGMIVFDASRRVRLANAAFAGLVGESMNELVGRHLEELTEQIRASMAGEKLGAAPSQPAVEQAPAADPASVARLDEIRASMNQKRGDTTAAG